MRGRTYPFIGLLERCLMHGIRGRRIRASSDKNYKTLSGGRKSMLPTRSKAALVLVTLTLFSFTRMKIPQIESIYRLLSHCSDALSFISLVDVGDHNGATLKSIRDLPPIAARRNVPSYILLCNEFVRRVDTYGENLNAINTNFGLEEDDSVCTDWAAPHISLIEMIASTVVGHAAARYKVTYKHNCGAAKYKDTSVLLGTDWTTIQQIFPVSSLVLDENSITEAEIYNVCQKCSQEFQQNNDNSVHHGANPSWFDPQETHHCILDPRTNTNSEQARTESQRFVLGRTIPSLKDRLLLASVANTVDEVDSEEDPRSYVSSSGNNLDSYYGSPHKDVVIYIEEGSMEMEHAAYEKHIHDQGVSSISIHLHPFCALQEICRIQGELLHKYLTKFHPSIPVTIDTVTSTAAAYSVMVLAKYLICPPGTTGCLIPAVSKGADTVAFIGESEDRPNTYRYFDFMKGNSDHLQVATVGTLTRKRLPDNNVEEEVFTNNERANTQDIVRTAPSEEALNIWKEDFSKTGFRDGCMEARGSIGSWEQDFSYDSLKDKNAQKLRGSSLDGVMVSDRFGGGTSMFHDISKRAERSIGGGRDDGDSNDGRDDDDSEDIREYPSTPSTPKSSSQYTYDDPCEMDFLNLKGLCLIMEFMSLSVITFVGDSYTQDMVTSFWDLLGLPADENPGNYDPQDTEDYERQTVRRTVTCENAKQHQFDIVFSPNENLVTDVEPVPVSGEVGDLYVDPAPIDQSTYGSTTTTTSATSATNAWTTPYATAPLTQQRANPMVPGSQPVYNNNCGCVPFMSQYQSNIQPPPPQPTIEEGYISKPRAKQFISVPMQPQQQPQYFQQQTQYIQEDPQYFPKQNRQIFVAGQRSVGYDQFCEQFDTFGQTVNQAVNPQDIVFMRSAMPQHGSCGCQACGRRTEEVHNMTEEEITMANGYMARSIHTYRRRTRQMDLLTYSPILSQKPRIHMLDVSHMTRSHPHAIASSAKNDHGRKLCQAQGMKMAPMVDSWNHLLYSNMQDMAMAQSQAVPHVRTMAAPPGTPYSYAIPQYQRSYFP